MKRRFFQLDVFGSEAGYGNGLAVVMDGAGLSTEAMQSFADWTQLAETTFLTPGEGAADYHVRIFTAGYEMPFAGHPTLGSAAAWLAAGHDPKAAGSLMQSCAIGLVEIDLSGAMPAFVAPPVEVAEMTAAEIALYAEAAGLGRATVRRGLRLTNGPRWTAFELADASAVLALDAARLVRPAFGGLTGVWGAYPPGGPVDYEVRMIDVTARPAEDPVTGSFNAAIARVLAAEGRLATPLTMAQGRRVGRAGEVHLFTRADGAVMVGGAARVLVEGSVEL